MVPNTMEITMQVEAEVDTKAQDTRQLMEERMNISSLEVSQLFRLQVQEAYNELCQDKVLKVRKMRRFRCNEIYFNLNGLINSPFRFN